MQDHHAYLDVARALWRLDDERLVHIASSDTATDAFREIALFVRELRAGLTAHPAGAREQMEAAALEQVAGRLAARTDISSIGQIPNGEEPS